MVVVQIGYINELLSFLNWSTRGDICVQTHVAQVVEMNPFLHSTEPSFRPTSDGWNLIPLVGMDPLGLEVLRQSDFRAQEVNS